MQARNLTTKEVENLLDAIEDTILFGDDFSSAKFAEKINDLRSIWGESVRIIDGIE